MIRSPANSWKHRRHRLSLDERINVTPFVDVVLVLLIVFMITAPLLSTTIPVQLPVARGTASNDIAPLVVTIQRDGSIFLGNESMTQQRLATELHERQRELSQDANVFVRADDAIDYGLFVQIVAAIRDANFQRISLVSLPDSIPDLPTNSP